MSCSIVLGASYLLSPVNMLCMIMRSVSSVKVALGTLPAGKRRKVSQGGHADTLQQAHGKRDPSQNDNMDRGGKR